MPSPSGPETTSSFIFHMYFTSSWHDHSSTAWWFAFPPQNVFSSSHPSFASSLFGKNQLVVVISVSLLVLVIANTYTAFIMSGTVLSALPVLNDLTLRTNLLDRYYY